MYTDQKIASKAKIDYFGQSKATIIPVALN
jgi:hypothetical protein